MQIFDKLNEENYLLFASKNYNNPQCTSIEEFYEDLQRIKYLKRLFSRYLKNKDLQERLIINHLVILYNVFGIQAANKMIFYKIDYEHQPILKTFLVYLNYIKESEYVDIPLDINVIRILRKL